MPTIEELLRASLQGANEKFDQANKGLHAAVVEAAKAVEAVTEGKATLRLWKQHSDMSSTRYALGVTVGEQHRQLSEFTVTGKGYPIHGKTGSDVQPFDSPEALSQYFKNLAADPNSPLIAFLAYIARNTPEVK